MSRLLTQKPIAIRILMNEAIFSSPVLDELTDSSLADENLTQNGDVLFEDEDSDFLYWGSNEREMLFLLRSPTFDYFSVEAEDAFLKTLAALKLTIEDVAVVNFEKTNKSFDEVKEVLNSKICIYCDGENEENRSFFNKLVEKDGFTLLYTYSFEEMLTDINKKRAFWNAIKEINVL
jgi:hypothetical protein